MAFTVIQIRRGNSGEWANENPILAQGEPGLELDTNVLKFGDGISTWSELPEAGGSGTVQSVNDLFPDEMGNIQLTASDVGAMPAGSSAQYIVLAEGEPVPEGTDNGTLIFREA